MLDLGKSSPPLKKAELQTSCRRRFIRFTNRRKFEYILSLGLIVNQVQVAGPWTNQQRVMVQEQGFKHHVDSSVSAPYIYLASYPPRHIPKVPWSVIPSSIDGDFPPIAPFDAQLPACYLVLLHPVALATAPFNLAHHLITSTLRKEDILSAFCRILETVAVRCLNGFSTSL